jgi:hypothetical protein
MNRNYLLDYDGLVGGGCGKESVVGYFLVGFSDFFFFFLPNMKVMGLGFAAVFFFKLLFFYL